MSALATTRDLGLKPFMEGKVRDLFDLGDRLLIVATDRISAYDVILEDPIPDKGRILTTMSVEWFRLLETTTPHHLISTELADFPEPFNQCLPLAGRSMLVHKAKRIDAECIVRGYLSGSGWRDYQRSGGVCGIVLPTSMQESQKIDPTIFTPSTKALEGHDENINMQAFQDLVGLEVADKLTELSLNIYKLAADYALQRGIILADTKFEFGWINNQITLIDEVLSPDSSRFWPANDYAVGRGQDSFDKQFVRDYLDTCDWDHTYPAPHLPQDIIHKTIDRYREALLALFPQAEATLEGMAQ